VLGDGVVVDRVELEVAGEHAQDEELRVVGDA